MEHLASRRKTWYLISLVADSARDDLADLLRAAISVSTSPAAPSGSSSSSMLSTTEQVTRGARTQTDSKMPVVQIADNSGTTNRVAVIRIKELQQGPDEKAALEQPISHRRRAIHRAADLVRRIIRRAEISTRAIDLRRRPRVGRHPALHRLCLPEHAEPGALRHRCDRRHASRRARCPRHLLDHG